MEKIPEFRKDVCINCEEVKHVKTIITLENCDVPIKTGCICYGCYWGYVRESLIGVIK